MRKYQRSILVMRSRAFHLDYHVMQNRDEFLFMMTHECGVGLVICVYRGAGVV